MRSINVVLAILFALPAHAMDILVDDSVLGFTVMIGTREVTGTFDVWAAEIDFDARRIRGRHAEPAVGQ